MSFLVGNAQLIDRFRTIRSQIDYGIFLPVQYGAIAALKEPEDAVLAQCAEYERRMKTLCEGLRNIGWDCENSEGTMFTWAPLPAGYVQKHGTGNNSTRNNSTENSSAGSTSSSSISERFVLDLMERAGVICTPGSSFGSLGEGYVRFALVLPPEEISEAVAAVRKSGILG